MRKPTRVWTLGLLIGLALSLLMPRAMPVSAAEPGEEIISSQGTINPQQQLPPIQVLSPGPVNIRLEVSGGAATDNVSVTLAGSASQSWSALSGEVVWGFVTIAANDSLVLRNNSSTVLSYKLTVYARGNIPAVTTTTPVWQGTARGGGIQSSIQLQAPTSGLYRFTLGATGGGFQIKVDNNAILKTVRDGNEPSNTDSVYYLTAGTHSFTIIQDPASAFTAWSVELAFVGGTNVLPNSETGIGLGSNQAFLEEWIPLQVAAGASVNVKIEVSGGALTDTLRVELYNGATKVLQRDVYSGEIQWATAATTGGANRLHIVAPNTNAQPLRYTLTLTEIPAAPFQWSGVTAGSQVAANQSTIRLNFPTAGLYSFNLTANSGRYQFRLDNNYFQKTITSTLNIPLSVYVTAGVHTLTVVQDSTHSRTAWNVAIATTNQTVDTLPYLRRGGTLGGPNNAFTQEWLPLRFNQNRPVNMRVATYGAPGNALQVTLYNGNSAVYTATTIYSGEIFWATSDVLSGANRLRIAATGANTSTVEYKIELLGIPTIPTSWSGIAQANGLNSTAQIFAPVAGVYDLSLVTTEGAGRLSISPTTLFDTDSAQAANVITTTQRVSLNAGMYNITFQQNSEARTVWQINVALNRTSGALSVTNALPLGVPVGQVSTVTLQGTGFTSVSQVELVSSGNSVTAITDFSITSDTALTFTVPASLPRGLYSIRVRSSGGSTVTYARKLTVGSRTFIPFVVR